MTPLGISAQPRKHKFKTYDKVMFDSPPRYMPASETGFEVFDLGATLHKSSGPNQVLASDVDTTSDPNGCVRIKLDNERDVDSTPQSIPGILMEMAHRYPDHFALVSTPDDNGNQDIYTYKDYEKSVRTVAKAFLKLGLERHCSVGIIGFNSPEWFISDIAAIFAGGFGAGIYTTNSPETCHYCLENSRANIVVVEDEKQLEKIMKVKESLTHLKAIIQYNDKPVINGVYSWKEILEIGENEPDDRLEAVLKTIGVNECCTLVYTSGTVGNPKAVMLNHDNLLQDVKSLVEAFNLRLASECVISYLPLSHIAAQGLDIYSMMIKAGTVYFANRNALKGTLISTLIAVRPTIFFGVPRVWEKIHEKMLAAARQSGTIKSWIISWAKAEGLQYNTCKMNGEEYKSWKYSVAKWMVFSKVKTALGLDKSKVFASGAAPIHNDLKRYFMSLDMPIMEAYGLSETSGAHSITVPHHYAISSVGAGLTGCCTKIDNIDENGEGEVCMNGRHIFMGYLNMPDKTSEAKDDNGWLHSGDLGKLDENGFLHITGRIKELIITSGGENVPPVIIERILLSELPILNNAMLIGDKRKYLSILVAIRTEMDADTGMPLDTLASDSLNWAKSIGSKSTTISEILKTKDPMVYREIEAAIERTNEKATSNAQKIQKFRILPHDFSLPTGELGPTLKLKRNVVLEMYADLIEEMYQE